MPRRLNTKVPSPDPLPRWLDLPLGSKLPMLRAPQGALILYTTKLSRKLRKNYRELDFDLNDPHSYGFNNEYKPLNDVYLKTFLGTPEMKKRLYHGGFITKDGKVLCSLKEYNSYRAYLRQINLDLEKRRLNLEKERVNRELRRRRQQQAAAMLRRRDEHLKEVQDRLSKQNQEDRIKFMTLGELGKEQRVMTEADREAARHWRRKQEIRQKMSTLRRWLQDDIDRTKRMEERRIEREEEKRQRLEDEWHRRKIMQRERLDAEEKKRQADEEEKTRRVQKRQDMIDKQREKLQDTLLQMVESRRSNRARREADYQRRLRTRVAKRRRRVKGYSDDEDDETVAPKSYWNIDDSLEHLIVAGQKPESEKGDAESQRASSAKAPARGGSAGDKGREERDPNKLYASDRRPTPIHADAVPFRPSQILAAKIEEANIQEGDEEEEEEEAGAKVIVPGSELDECRCSLMKLHKVAKDMGNFDAEAKALAGNLHEIMSDLKLGKLKPYQVQKLTDFATDILQPRLSPDHICDTPSPTPTVLSSEFAKNIISEVIDSVQDSLLPIDARKKPTDITPLTKSLAKRAIALTTSKILSETDVMLEKPLAQPEEEPSLRKSYTSDLVKVVLNKSAGKIVRDMRGSVNSNAELKAYIDDIIQQCMQELVQEYLDEKVPKVSEKKKPNYVSVASMLVRDTITDVIKELCEQSKIPSPFGGILPGTASSVFVESVILETMRECLQELRDKEVEPERLVEYSTDILASHTILTKRASKDDKNDDKLAMECGHQRASSTLLDGLVFHLVTGMLRAIKSDEVSKNQIKKMEGVLKPAKQATDPATRVSKALQSVLEDIGGNKPPIQVLLHWDTKVPLQDIVFSTQAKSLESLHAETAVLQALHDGQQKVYAPQESPDSAKGPPKERKLSAMAERCVSMVLGRAVHEYFNDKQKQGGEKPKSAKSAAASENVDDLVDYSIGLVIMQLANESQGGEATLTYPGITPATTEAARKSPGSTKKGKVAKKGKKGKKGPPPFPTKKSKKARPSVVKAMEASPPPRPVTPPPQNKPKSQAPKPKAPTPKSASSEEEDEEVTSKSSAAIDGTPQESKESAVTGSAPQDSKETGLSSTPEESKESGVSSTPQDSQTTAASGSTRRRSRRSLGSQQFSSRGSFGSQSDRRRSSVNAHCGHTIVDDNEYAHSDESDECSLEPMVDNQAMSSIDPTIVENNLSVLSVKKLHDLHHYQPNQAVARNSFRNLVNPNVHKVRRFSNENEDEIASHIEQLIEEHEQAVKENPHQSGQSCSSDESSASDDAPEPGEKDELVSVTEIHTADELHSVKAMSKSLAKLKPLTSQTSVHGSESGSAKSAKSAKSGGSQKSVKSGGSQKSVKSGGSQRSAKSGGSQRSNKSGGSQRSRPVVEEYQETKPISASIPSVIGKSETGLSKKTSKSVHGSGTSLDRKADIPTSDVDETMKEQENRSIKSASSAGKGSGRNSAAPSEGDRSETARSAPDDDVTETARSIPDDTAIETEKFGQEDSSEAKTVTEMVPTDGASEVTKTVQEELDSSEAKSLTEIPSDEEQAIEEKIEKKSPVMKKSSRSSSRASVGKSGDVTMEAVPSRKSSTRSVNSTGSVKKSSHQMLDQTPRPSSSRKKSSTGSVQLTPKASLRSLPPTNTGTTSGPIGNESQSGSVNLSQKSAKSSLDGLSRARLSHAHKDAPETTASDTAAEERHAETPPHSPVGSMPDMQTSDADVTEKKEED